MVDRKRHSSAEKPVGYALTEITFPDAVVVITKNLPLFTAPGNIGLKFFEKTDTVFDFDHSVVYMKGK